MLIFHYKTKKELRESIGKCLRFTETSLFGAEYHSEGTFLGTNHPKRSWFAEVTMKGGKIYKIDGKGQTKKERQDAALQEFNAGIAEVGTVGAVLAAKHH